MRLAIDHRFVVASSVALALIIAIGVAVTTHEIVGTPATRVAQSEPQQSGTDALNGSETAEASGSADEPARAATTTTQPAVTNDDADDGDSTGDDTVDLAAVRAEELTPEQGATIDETPVDGTAADEAVAGASTTTSAPTATTIPTTTVPATTVTVEVLAEAKMPTSASISLTTTTSGRDDNDIQDLLSLAVGDNETSTFMVTNTGEDELIDVDVTDTCLLYTSPSPRDS